MRYDSALPPVQRYGFDAGYVDRLTAGDRETEDHFARYFGSLLTIKLRARLRSAALVQDAKQETLLRVITTLKQKGGLASPESLGAFVNSVANNVLFELYRTESKVVPFGEDAPEIADEGASMDAVLATSEERERVRKVIAQLPPKDRNLLTWLFFEERNKDEVCRELNIDRNYLRLLVHRAKARFRAELERVTAV
jgi:RNA polymerase sigma-70 factor, ECF subfamily